MEQARRLQFGLVVGGDFNTQLHVGFRGSLLNDLVDRLELQIANDDVNHDPHKDTWTFESSMGVRRRIDFFCCLAFPCHCCLLPPLIASTWGQIIVPSSLPLISHGAKNA